MVYGIDLENLSSTKASKGSNPFLSVFSLQNAAYSPKSFVNVVAKQIALGGNEL